MRLLPGYYREQWEEDMITAFRRFEKVGIDTGSFNMVGLPEETPFYITRFNAGWRYGRAVRELARINSAYGVLGYPDRRADYDRRRAAQLLAVVEGRQNGAPRREIEPAPLAFGPPGGRP